jgi:hypothetical protein
VFSGKCKGGEMKRKIFFSVLLMLALFLLPAGFTVHADPGDGMIAVTYDPNGGQFAEMVTNADGSVTFYDDKGSGFWISRNWLLPPDDSKALYGWSTDKNGENIVVDATEYYYPEENITLYAVWKKGHKVTYDANIEDGYYNVSIGSQYSSKYSIAVLEGDSLEGQYYVPQRDSSADRLYFIGYNTKKDGSGKYIYIPGEYEPNEDVTLYAQWAVLYTVRYHTTDGYFLDPYGQPYKDEEIRYHVGDTINLNTHIPKIDYNKVFLGWSRKENGDVIDEIPNLSKDEDIYAVWGEGYEIIFDGNGGKISIANELSERETMLIAPGMTIYGRYDDDNLDYQQEGFVFDHWEDEEGNKITSDFIPSGNMTLKAIWAEACEVTFDANGGYFDEVDYEDTYTDVVKKGDRIYLPPVKKEGAAFLEWKDEDGNTIKAGTKVTKNMKVYAIWTNKNLHNVTLDAGSGWIFDPFDYNNKHFYSVTVTDDQEVELPICDDEIWLDGDFFVGWYADPEFKELVCEYSGDDYYMYIPEDENVTLYAKFEKGYTVTFNGGRGWVRNNLAKTYEVSVRKGYPIGYEIYGYIQQDNAESYGAFTGWYSDEACTNRVSTRDSISSFIPAKDLVLYAGYEDDTIHVTGVEGVKNISLGVGDEYALRTKVIPANATNQAVIFESSNQTVATVDKDGTIKAHNAGVAEITVTTVDGECKAFCKVIVEGQSEEDITDSIERVAENINRLTDKSEAKEQVDDFLESFRSGGKWDIDALSYLVDRIRISYNIQNGYVNLDGIYARKANIRYARIRNIEKTAAKNEGAEDSQSSLISFSGAALNTVPDSYVGLFVQPISESDIKKVDSKYTNATYLDLSLKTGKNSPTDPVTSLKAPLIMELTKPANIPNSRLVVLQLNGGNWEILDPDLFSGSMRIVVDRLSPIAIVELAAGKPGNGNKTDQNDNGNKGPAQIVEPVIEPSPAPVGTTTLIKSGTYVVTGAYEAGYKAPADKKLKKLTVALSVVIDGQTYIVTSIESGALKGCKNLTSVTIPESVTRIKKNAFSGCGKLGKITVNGNTLKKVEKGAFKGVKKGATVIVYAKDKKTYDKAVKMLKSAGLKNAKFKFKKKK